MDEFYHVLFNGSRGVEVFEDAEDGEENYWNNFNLTLERARYVQDHIINPDCNPRIVRGDSIE